MAPSILGKRTRSSARLDASGTPGRGSSDNTTSTRSADSKSKVATLSKRRQQFVIHDEGENDNPFVTPKKQYVRDEDAMDVDEEEAAEEKPITKRGRKNGTTPAKHDAPGTRLPLATAQENSPRKALVDIPEKFAPTPSTPRHRDALAGKVAVTPRHRLIIAGRSLTPRTPHTPGTPRNSAPTIYNEARQVFARGSAPTALFGREEERKELESFITTRAKSKKSGCIYVSGPPGTGKSAFVNDVCCTVSSESVKTGYINCMSVKNAVDLYRTLLEELVDITEIAEGDEMDALKSIFMQRKTSYVVTLDEVDHLLELDIDLFYNIFEWSLQKSSSLVLIGIANALDLTDRFLPRLKARGLKPQLLPFLPYTAQQISSVITSKLKALLLGGSGQLPFIHPTAILFLSKKVAAQSGDLRKAFDICRRAIDLIESDVRDQHTKKAAEITPSPTPSPSKTPLVENMNLSSPTKPSLSRVQELNSVIAASLASLTVETAPRATIAHMAKITAAVFSNGTSQRLRNLNLQQKAVLCSLSAIEAKRRATAADAVFSTPSRRHNTSPTIKELFEAYTQLCKRENILHPLTSTEFRDIVGSLETLSLISAVEGKAGSLDVGAGTPSRRGRGKAFPGVVVEERRVASVIGAKELGDALVGPGAGILRGILDGNN
jgi:cell division control protein 6